MSILTITKSNHATKVWFDENKFYILLEDARELAVPLDWFPKLRDATKEQLNNWRLIGDGEGIHWQDLDEDISVEMLLV
jgi:hypothetical protein